MRGRATRLLVILLVVGSATLVGASPSYAAPVSDTFDRADGTDLGAGWVESGTDLAIAGQKLTNPVVSNPFAQAVGGTGQAVAADVTAGSGGGSYAKLSLRVASAQDNYSVLLMDELPGDGQVAFTTLKLLVGETVVRQQLVGLVPSARLRLVNVYGDTVRATVDTGGSPGPEFTETWTMTSTASGSGIGVGASGGATVDDFASSVLSPTTTTLTYDPTTPRAGDEVVLVADVTGSGGAGSVEFTINGVTTAPQPVDVTGRASFGTSDLTLGSNTVTAHFVPADETRQESVDTQEITVLERSRPTITATLSSAIPPTAYGWYRSPVTVTYACAPDGSPLASPCPAGDTVTGEGENRTVTRSVEAEDGGVGEVTVSVDIDLTAPTVRLQGIVDAPYLSDPGKGATCVGTDALSRIASCVVDTVELSGGKVRVRAVAMDRAGNRGVDEATVRTATSGILKAAYVKGAYEVTRGKKYTVVVVGKARPAFLGFRSRSVTPRAFTRKNGRWELKVTVPAGLALGKEGMRIRTGGRTGTTFTVRVTVRR